MTDKPIIVPDFPELVFQEEPHLYLLDGQCIPSVSNIMEPLRHAHYDGISEATLRNAAARGTAIHNAIENFIKFGIIDIPKDYRGYFDAFLDWWAQVQPEVIGSEIRMYHKLMRYAGTCDLLCTINGETHLIDYKSTSSVSEMTCGVQLEAYAQALASHNVEVAHKSILHLKSNGKYKVVDFVAHDAPRWRVFGACKTVYDYVHTA